MAIEWHSKLGSGSPEYECEQTLAYELRKFGIFSKSTSTHTINL